MCKMGKSRKINYGGGTLFRLWSHILSSVWFLCLNFSFILSSASYSNSASGLSSGSLEGRNRYRLEGKNRPSKHIFLINCAVSNNLMVNFLKLLSYHAEGMPLHAHLRITTAVFHHLPISILISKFSNSVRTIRNARNSF